MFIIQGLHNTPSLVLYGCKNRLKTCERFAFLDPQIPMWGARLTALLAFYRMRRLNMGPNTILSFRKNKWANSEKTYKQKGLTGWTDRWKDRSSFIGPFWPCLGVQKKKPVKKFYSLRELLVGNRNMTQGGQEAACVRRFWNHQILAS